jgi:hypothetical protein
MKRKKLWDPGLKSSKSRNIPLHSRPIPSVCQNDVNVLFLCPCILFSFSITHVRRLKYDLPGAVYYVHLLFSIGRSAHFLREDQNLQRTFSTLTIFWRTFSTMTVESFHDYG